jgi:MSHA pilin protein MshB
MQSIKTINYYSISNIGGFTLIELVIVIVLISILSAVALPKFSNLTTQARQAASAGVAGGLSAGVSVAHAQWLASGSPSSISLEGQIIYMSPVVNGIGGWPEDTAATGSGVATASKCLNVWNSILNNPPIAGITCTGNCQYLVTVNASPICRFTDQQGNGSNTITYNINTGAVVAP